LVFSKTGRKLPGKEYQQQAFSPIERKSSVLSFHICHRLLQDNSKSMSRSTISDFEVLSRLGAGSFGTVYKVRRHADGENYVIKNVRIVELSRKEQADAINEVQLLSQLKSPFVVRYYDSFIENNSLHIGRID
jgi:serine/threonine protein kinase